MRSRRFRFVHAADLHLDTQFVGMARTSAEVASALRDASLAAWDALVELAIERDAAFVLLAGDVYDGAERGVRAQLRFRRGLERLAENGIEALIVHGNHDPVGEGWAAIRRWPPGVKVFGSERVECARVERDGRVIARVQGISYAQREVRDNLALRFERQACEPGVLDIGLLHCNVGGASEHSDYSPCSVEDLASVGLDYWALGHVHRHSVIRGGDPWIVYPGNLQGRSAKPSECGKKGAVVVEVEDGAVRDVAFAPLDLVRFAHLDLDASDCQDLAMLERVLDERVRALRDEHAGRGLVVRARIEGRGPCAADLRRPGAELQLLEELREAWQASSPFVWWESLRSDMRSAIDRELLALGGDFRAELIQLSDALASGEGALARFCAENFDGLPVRAEKAAGAELEADALIALLAEAESLALDLLEPEEPA